MNQLYHADLEFERHTPKPREIKLTSPEFDEFTRQFYQDLMEDIATEEEIITFALSPFSDNSKRTRLRSYLGSITKDNVSNEELRKLWWSSLADVVFYDGAELRAFLERVRDRL